MRLRLNINQSLLARALASNLVLVGISGILITALFLWLQLTASRRQLDLRAGVLVEFVATQSEYAMLVGDEAELDRIARNTLSIEDVLFVALIDRSGGMAIRVNRPEFPSQDVPRTSGADTASKPVVRALGERSFLEVTRAVVPKPGLGVVEWETRQSSPGRVGTVRIGFSMEKQRVLRNRTIAYGVTAAAVLLLLILTVQYFQLRRLLRPLQGLIEFTRHVGEGRLDLKAPVERVDEIGRLAIAFNHMLEKLGSTTVSKNYVNNIIRSMAESLVVIGVDGTVQMVNQATLSMLGCSEEEVLGWSAELILAGGLQEGGGSGVERVYRLKNGRELQVLFSASAMRGENGQVEGHVWLAQDITERKQKEEELSQAKQQAEQASRAKSDFLSRTSHELRTPLNAILGFGQLLEIGDLAASDRESVDQIMKAGRHLLKLINEVLDIAGIESGRRSMSKEPIRVGDAAGAALDLVRPLAASRGVEIRSRLLGWADHFVLADHQRLQQVLLNLLSNAVKYNCDNGVAIISCEEGQNSALRLMVTDTGSGIPTAGLARLFVPFERLDADQKGIEGTGLGLAFSKSLVEAMGGRIGVESILGQGSTFWVELPLVEAPLKRLEREGQGPITLLAIEGQGARTVLYIEDNLSNLELVERILARLPAVKLLTAPRGEQGVEMARRHRPDVILLDLHLPDIWGDEVLHRLRSDPQTSSIPAVVLSADATEGQIQRLLAAGARAYLTKPLDVHELLGVLNDILKEAPLTHA